VKNRDKEIVITSGNSNSELKDKILSRHEQEEVKDEDYRYVYKIRICICICFENNNIICPKKPDVFKYIEISSITIFIAYGYYIEI